MKKTIAKVLAAAVALSTVVAPNVSAHKGVSANGGGVIFSSLYVSGSDESKSILNSDVDNYSNPLDVKITNTEKNSADHYKYVYTDLDVYGRGPVTVNNDLVWFDGKNLVANVNVADATVTDLTNGDINSNYNNTGDSVRTTDVAQLYKSLNLGNSTSVNVQAAALIEALKDRDVLADTDPIVSRIDNAISANMSATNVQAVVVSGDSKYKDDVVRAIFDVEIDSDGNIMFVVQDPTSTTDALINDAINSTNPLKFKLTLRFKNAYSNSGTTLTQFETRSVWVRLSKGTLGNYTHYVLLKKDNNAYTEIGVNITKDANNYATIVSADTDKLALDSAKGGRLLLDYVYDVDEVYNGAEGDTNRANASATSTSNAFKIRRIGSRVFKGGKFQQISGWGDDGAQYIRTINNGAFRKCKQLKKVNLDTSKKIRKINAKAFYDCKKLATVKLDGRNLKAIGSGAFKNCKSNITFKIKGNKSQVAKAWKKIKKQAPSKAKYSKI